MFAMNSLKWSCLFKLPLIILYDDFRDINDSFKEAPKQSKTPINKIFVMRILLVSLLTLPFFASAQINRSANEVARESIQEYISQKLFKNQAYTAGQYGDLQSQLDRESHVAWSITHQFEIMDSQYVSNKRIPVRTAYNFSFYLDKKLKVIKAEGYHREWSSICWFGNHSNVQFWQSFLPSFSLSNHFFCILKTYFDLHFHNARYLRLLTTLWDYYFFWLSLFHCAPSHRILPEFGRGLCLLPMSVYNMSW